MKDINNIIISKNSTIKEALEIINNGSMRIVLVIENLKLIGIIDDSDIRRAMLRNYNLSDSITDIINKNPVVCHINDTKEKILQTAILKKVYEIPIVDDNGNIAGIEELDELLKEQKKKNKVVLMVGGLGSRLKPLTDDLPKPLLKVGNKPILETIIEKISEYGFKDFILSVNYKSGMIEEYFGDGKDFGVDIKYIHEEKRLGTAGALSLMKEDLIDDFFVMNGDLLTNINFEHLKDFHVKHNASATMCVREYDFQVPFGVVNINEGEIVSIEEKPVHKFFVNAGIYMLSPDVIHNIPQNEFYDMPELFKNLIDSRKNTVSFPIREYWLDIGRVEEFEKANSEYHNVF